MFGFASKKDIEELLKQMKNSEGDRTNALYDEKINRIERSTEDIAEMRIFIRNFAQSLESQAANQKELQTMQFEALKTQTAQTEAIQKISETLDRHNREIVDVKRNQEESETKMELKLSDTKKEIMAKTYEDKKEITSMVEKIMQRVDELSAKIDANSELSKININKLFADGFSKALIGAIIAAVTFFLAKGGI